MIVTKSRSYPADRWLTENWWWTLSDVLFPAKHRSVVVITAVKLMVWMFFSDPNTPNKRGIKWDSAFSFLILSNMSHSSIHTHKSWHTALPYPPSTIGRLYWVGLDHWAIRRLLLGTNVFRKWHRRGHCGKNSYLKKHILLKVNLKVN